MDLRFLRLKNEHLDEVLGIEQLSFPQPWTRGMFEREIALPISHFYVAKQSQSVVGYGGYWSIEDEAHIINLAVHPGCRGQGLGRQILHYLLEQMARQGLRRILLEVRATNNPARGLYESEGFSRTGLRPKYYGNEDAILMEKTLPEAIRPAGQ